ncbi:putative DsbA family dithiol-disulfide isomerase [Sinorhizobium kostiense]|uniref:DsbA family dithiol-disulfide isomerase n=1 Tax=Sinorhizobium kostiense TaxID=76747 RepID=A0ABS4R640_9HYPH|nr:putative DsbA family dithiol-disulfide isomerase [Sinorhizobium kostiense]
MTHHLAGSALGTVRDDETAAPAAVEIVYYTDPLCCWSWAFEPQWRMLRYAFAGQMAWRYRMAGMLRCWDDYQDPVNSIHRPAQMGPLWLQAHQTSGMPLDARIWTEDQPSSSWPACLLVKAAELQSPIAAELILRRLREAVMTERRNIARQSVLHEIIDACAEARPDVIDPQRLRCDMDGDHARTNFMDDVKNARFRQIGRFPALVIRRPRTAGVLVIGWRPFEALLRTVAEVAPELGPGRRPRDADVYLAFWPQLTTPELELALEIEG